MTFRSHGFNILPTAETVVAVGTIGKSHYTVGRRREKSFAVFLELWAEITFA